MSRRDRGMALAVVLILLLGLSVLAIAGLADAVASAALAGYGEQAALAFEAAEAAISRALRPGAAPSTPAAVWPELWPSVTGRAERLPDHADTPGGWPDGFSVGSGAGTFELHHYTIQAEGRAARGATVRVDQGVAILAVTGESSP